MTPPPLSDLPPVPGSAPFPAPAPATPVAPPVLPSAFARLDALDLLRGVAILGIFLMNTWSMSMPEDAYMNPNSYTTDWVRNVGFPDNVGPVHGGEYLDYVVIHLFADMKFITMFSMLFGAGILLQAERAAARGLSPWRIHYSRMAVLLVFGFVHAYALWYGDILTTYAMCGILLFPLRKFPPTVLLLIGLGMIGVVTAIELANAQDCQIAPITAIQNWGDHLVDELSGNDVELATYQGGWWEQMHHRGWTSFEGETAGFMLWSFWRCGGAILIGMALLRRKFFHGAWPCEAYATITALAIPIGWMITYLGVVFNDKIGWSEDTDTVFSIWSLGSEFNYWGSLLTEFGYIAFGVLVAMWAVNPARWFLRKCLVPIRAIGRLALSNYIAQTIIGTTIFYGHGFGLFGQLSRPELLYVVFGVWAVQLTLSPIYLKYFRQGPLEWLWHRIVYWRGEPPPLRDPTIPNPA